VEGTSCDLNMPGADQRLGKPEPCPNNAGTSSRPSTAVMLILAVVIVVVILITVGFILYNQNEGFKAWLNEKWSGLLQRQRHNYNICHHLHMIFVVWCGVCVVWCGVVLRIDRLILSSLSGKTSPEVNLLSAFPSPPLDRRTQLLSPSRRKKRPKTAILTLWCCAGI
jgi:hypothetical protein